MFCLGGGGFRRGQSRLFATPGSANPLACTRWQGPQYQPVSGARRRQAEADPTLCVPTSPPVAPACSWVCSLACATHAHDGWWCTGISLWPPNGSAESFAPSRRGR
ncbi:hypothetical protein NDU88_000703 [Pleurodeles waltl]|uniref:Uncharacterized protein n=1 Tax=Pleurodeles waltl TaxID=8319 RepID=A0AAV7NAF8_PLEWA|nr:hypothetical protein NDU88_000703 [Pleurodeles waltl]